MIFEEDKVDCTTCGRTINRDDDQGYDEPTCPPCYAKYVEAFANTNCHFCKKKVGRSNVWYNIEDTDDLAHEECVAKLTEIEQEGWSDEYG